MERINLSDFKAISKYEFINGLFKKIEKNLENKELEFFSMSEETVKSLIEKQVSNNDIEFLYDIIPVLSNVNCDIDFKEFEKMCKYPSAQLADYITLLLNHFKELCLTANKLNDLESNVAETMKELNIEIPVIEPVKTKEEQIEELYAELSTCTSEDKEKRREIMKKIQELENE